MHCFIVLWSSCVKRLWILDKFKDDDDCRIFGYYKLEHYIVFENDAESKFMFYSKLFKNLTKLLLHSLASARIAKGEKYNGESS